MCVEGKMHQQSFKPVGEICSTRKLQLIHSDICGPMSTESIGGRKYFVTFIDYYSWCCSVYFLRHKSEVLETFKEFEAVTTVDSGQRVGPLWTDNGGEYLSNEFKAHLKSKRNMSWVDSTLLTTAKWSGWKNESNLNGSAQSMIAHAGLSNCYWAEAVATAAYVKNQMPSTAIKEDQTPYKWWYCRKPNVGNLKVFGCIAYAHTRWAQTEVR